MKHLVLLCVMLLNTACAAEFTKESLLVDIGVIQTMLSKDENTVKFFHQYINPAQLKAAAKTDAEIEEMVKVFNESEKKTLLRELLTKIDPDKLIVDDAAKTMSAPSPLPGGRAMVFSFIDSRWYMNN